jgi:hypothetical protein
MVDVAQLVEPRIVIPAVVGSSPIVHPILRGAPGRPTPRRRTHCGLLAQLVEQLTLNQLVIGSSPIRPTIFSDVICRGSAG